jgi:hypothetical protein
MQLLKNLIAKHDRPAAPPPLRSPEARRTITQEFMEHHGAKPAKEDGLFTARRRSNRLHPLGGQG